MLTKRVQNSGKGVIDGFCQWIDDWWQTIVCFMGILIVFNFVIIPWFSLSETRLKDGAHLMTEQQLLSTVAEFENEIHRLSNSIESSQEQYVTVMRLYRMLDVQCNALFATHPATASGMAMSNRDLPCTKFSVGGVKYDFDRYTTQFRQGVVTDMKMDSRPYHMEAIELVQQRADADCMSAGANLTETIYHPEVIWESFSNSILVAILFFIFRLKMSGSYIICELISGRLLLKAMFWPVTIWSYPNADIARQVREMRRWAGYLLSLFISLLSANIAKAASAKDDAWSISGGGSVQTSYVINNGKAPTRHPVIQPWAKAMYGTSDMNVYVSSWASIGTQRGNVGDEVDVTAGVFTTIGNVSVSGVTIDGSFNYYRFLATHTGLYAAKMAVCDTYLGVCGKFQYMIPDTHDKSGMQLGLSWKHVWEKLFRFTTDIGVVHTRDVYGSKPITVLKAQATIPFGSSGWGIFTRIYKPLRNNPDDETRIVSGIEFAF